MYLARPSKKNSLLTILLLCHPPDLYFNPSPSLSTLIKVGTFIHVFHSQFSTAFSPHPHLYRLQKDSAKMSAELENCKATRCGLEYELTAAKKQLFKDGSVAKEKEVC